MPTPLNHSTRSINCLIRSPRDHSVNTSGNWTWLQESFQAAGNYYKVFGLTFFNVDTDASFELASSSLIKRHAQARVMSWASLTFYSDSWSYDKYDYDYSHTDGNGQLNYGLPVYSYNDNSYVDNLNPGPVSPCKMSTFSVEGRTNEFANVYNLSNGFYQSSPAQIIMNKPNDNTNYNPISMGPSAGVTA